MSSRARVHPGSVDRDIQKLVDSNPSATRISGLVRARHKKVLPKELLGDKEKLNAWLKENATVNPGFIVRVKFDRDQVLIRRVKVTRDVVITKEMAAEGESRIVDYLYGLTPNLDEELNVESEEVSPARHRDWGTYHDYDFQLAAEDLIKLQEQ